MTRAEFPDLSPWFFASLSVEDPLGHRSAAVGLAYLADQVLGRPLLAEERARRAEAEALAPGTLLAVREDSPDGAWLRVEASVGGQIVQGWMHRATVTFASRPLDSALVSRP